MFTLCTKRTDFCKFSWQCYFPVLVPGLLTVCNKMVAIKTYKFRLEIRDLDSMTFMTCMPSSTNIRMFLVYKLHFYTNIYVCIFVAFGLKLCRSNVTNDSKGNYAKRRAHGCNDSLLILSLKNALKSDGYSYLRKNSK